MSAELVIASWNVCLGMIHKKDFIAHEINKEKIDICCLQECEVPNTVDESTLTFPGYKIELEDMTLRKERVFIFETTYLTKGEEI